MDGDVVAYGWMDDSAEEVMMRTLMRQWGFFKCGERSHGNIRVRRFGQHPVSVEIRAQLQRKGEAERGETVKSA